MEDGTGRHTRLGRRQSRVEDIGEACQLFESSEKKQKDLQAISRYARLYDDIMAKHAESVKLLQDSVSVMDSSKQRFAAELFAEPKLLRSPLKVLRQLATNGKLFKEVLDYLITLPYEEIERTVKNMMEGKFTVGVARILGPVARPLKETFQAEKSFKVKEQKAQREILATSVVNTSRNVDAVGGGPNLQSEDCALKSPTNYSLNKLRFEAQQSAMQEKEMANIKPSAINHKRSSFCLRRKKKQPPGKRDFSSVYQTFVDYYASVTGKSRKTTPGPMDYMVKSHMKNRGNELITQICHNARIFTRRNTQIPSAVSPPRTCLKEKAVSRSFLNSRKGTRNIPKPSQTVCVWTDAKAESFVSPPPKNDVSVSTNLAISSIMKSCDKFARDTRTSFSVLRNGGRELRSQYHRMRGQLEAAGVLFNSKDVNREIKRNVSQFRTNKVCFIYGSKGQGRYIFASKNGQLRDRIKEADYVFGNRILRDNKT